MIIPPWVYPALKIKLLLFISFLLLGSAKVAYDFSLASKTLKIQAERIGTAVEKERDRLFLAASLAGKALLERKDAGEWPAVLTRQTTSIKQALRTDAIHIRFYDSKGGVWSPYGKVQVLEATPSSIPETPKMFQDKELCIQLPVETEKGIPLGVIKVALEKEYFDTLILAHAPQNVVVRIVPQGDHAQDMGSFFPVGIHTLISLGCLVQVAYEESFWKRTLKETGVLFFMLLEISFLVCALLLIRASRVVKARLTEMFREDRQAAIADKAIYEKNLQEITENLKNEEAENCRLHQQKAMSKAFILELFERKSLEWQSVQEALSILREDAALSQAPSLKAIFENIQETLTAKPMLRPHYAAMTSFEVSGVIESVLRFYDQVFAKKNIDIQTPWLPKESYTILGDRFCFQWILLSLFAYLVEGLVKGGVLRISCRATTQHLTLIIEDDGVGWEETFAAHRQAQDAFKNTFFLKWEELHHLISRLQGSLDITGQENRKQVTLRLPLMWKNLEQQEEKEWHNNVFKLY